ncbi:MAG: hypothetical protein K6T56_11460 [Burkholderiales bacterium]|nr:hypothetical protein [Burkholderiales bacterium]
MTGTPLPLYEVEFIPVERRLRERRQANPTARWNGVERRRGERRQPETPPVRPVA